MAMLLRNIRRKTTAHALVAAPDAAEPCAAGPLSRDEFLRALRRERARSDRSGRPFSLLVFRMRDGATHASAFSPLLNVLGQRLRWTDEVGWLEEGRPAALLFEASASDAWRVADDIMTLYPAEQPAPLCEVFSYPADDESKDSADGNRNNGEARRRIARPMDPLFIEPQPAWKRLVDVAGATAGLLLLAPLLLSAAAAVKVFSPGPALFKQRRRGLGGRPFWMYKFRTMVTDAERRQSALRRYSEQDGPAFKIKDDPRVTIIGKLMRVTSVDELPQLWNVLKGDMSLVGPRPLPCDESDACARWQRRRLDVKPGLTCFWQVHGRSAVSFEEWMRMDLRYVRAQSLPTDLKLITLTVPAMFRGH